MRIWAAAVAAILWSGAAGAAAPLGSDKVSIAAAPAWVQPVTMPAAAAQASGAPIQLLVQDQQVSFEPGGKTAYSRSVLKVQTPQGLAAGAINFAWNPEFDQPIVHKLEIRRGDQVIDVLASQTFTVVRRESNLEIAMLDGVLTATLQPEGLQVGDIVDFALSIRSRAPLLGGHLEQMGGGWNGLTVAKASFRASWPASMPMRLRQSEGLPAIKVVSDKAGKRAEIALDALPPLTPPAGAPSRYRMVRMIELSDLADWSDLAGRMAPLYVTAAALPATGPLPDEIARIRAEHSDPAGRVQAALTLVQDRVRYVFLGMNGGNYVPADAATTWSRRFGDCKGKTALLIAVLHALDIDAVPVLVSSTIGDGIDRHLPLLGMFDHIIVRALVGGRTYWLDGTRTGDRLDRLEVPAFGFGLPVQPRGATLVRIMPPPLDQPNTATEIEIDARNGISLPAAVKGSTLFRGDAALGLKLALANLAPDQRDQAVRAFWREQIDGIEIDSAAESYDAASGEQKMTVAGKVKLEWNKGWYEITAGQIGYKADFHREPGPNPDAPYQVGYPFYTSQIQKIVLPAGYNAKENVKPSETAQTIAGAEYRRKLSIDGNTVTVAASTRTIAPEFPAAEAAAAQVALRKLNDDRLYLRNDPPGYVATQAEIAAAAASAPTDELGISKRAFALVRLQRHNDAVAELTKLIALNPKSVFPVAARADSYIKLGKYADAERDVDAAAAIEPRSSQILYLRGALADARGQTDQAVQFYTDSMAASTESPLLLSRRAAAFHRQGKDDQALADAAKAIKLWPQGTENYLLRAIIFRSRGDADSSAGEARALEAAASDYGFAQVAAARIFAAIGQSEAATAAFSRALAIKPEAYIYINRGFSRPKAERAQRQADFEEALKLEPTNAEAIYALADVMIEKGDTAGAASRLTAILAKEPKNLRALVKRGIAHARANQSALAEKDFAAARSEAKTASALNELCWSKATAGVSLTSALAECDAGLVLEPDDAETLDSRAFVLLRTGRIDEAIAAYDRAIAIRPKQGASLYGRAVAYARKGDKARADAEAEAARKIDPEVAGQYASYGVAM